MIRLNVEVWVEVTPIVISGGHIPGSALDERVVELFQSTFACEEGARAKLHKGMHYVHRWFLTIGGIEVVDVGITEGTTGHCITANTNTERNESRLSHSGTTKRVATNLATGPIMLKISKSIASVTVGSSSPT